MKRYTIQITEKQMLQLERACEAMARLINGQMFPLQNICEFAWEKHVQKPRGLESCSNEFFEMRRKVENCLNVLHILCWDIPVGTDYGLHHSPDSDILWDMYQVFRHHRFLEMSEEQQERSRMSVIAEIPWGIVLVGTTYTLAISLTNSFAWLAAITIFELFGRI